MLEKIPRAVALRAMIVVSLIVCSPAFPRRGRFIIGERRRAFHRGENLRYAIYAGLPAALLGCRNGRLYLEIPQLNVDMLYFDSLPYGTGPMIWASIAARYRRPSWFVSSASAQRFYWSGPNEKFRSSGARSGLQLAVRQSFPESILGSFTLAAENSTAAAGAVLVDATDFFLRDVHGVSEALGKAGSL